MVRIISSSCSGDSENSSLVENCTEALVGVAQLLRSQYFRLSLREVVEHDVEVGFLR